MSLNVTIQRNNIIFVQVIFSLGFCAIKFFILFFPFVRRTWGVSPYTKVSSCILLVYWLRHRKGANMESWQSMAECTGLLIRHTMTIVS